MHNPLAEDTDVGKQIGNYRLHTFLGTDRGIRTFLGQHIHLQTEVIVKFYQLRIPRNDQRNFLTEARAIAGLIHPHILRIVDSGIDEDTPFLITPFVKGGTLHQLYPPGTMLPLPMLLTYARQIAAALDYAHSQDRLHLDIRPAHMWLKSENTLLLSDFRIVFSAFNSRSESVSTLAESAAYIAPEQIQGHPCPASDQYALAAVLYEWLCGSRPFTSPNYIEIAQQHLQAIPPSLRNRRPDLPLAIEQAILRAMSKDPQERFPSVQAFVQSLEQSSPTRERASRRSIDQLDTRSTHILADERSSTQAFRARQTRRKAILGLTGLVGVATVGFAIDWFIHSPFVNTPKQPPHPSRHAKPGTTFATYKGHSDIVYGVAWSSDGQKIASWGRDDTMQILDANTFAQLQTIPMSSTLAWSPDWKTIASGGMAGMQVWEVASGSILFSQTSFFDGAGGPLDLPINTQVQWSPDGNSLLSLYLSVQVWSVHTRKLLFNYPFFQAGWSPDSRYIILQEADYDYSDTKRLLNVHLLDVHTENQIAQYQVPNTHIISIALRWSPDGKYIASGDGSVWQATTGKSVRRYQSQRLFTDCTWSPDSKYLAFFNNSHYSSLVFNDSQEGPIDPTVQIWSPFTGQVQLIYNAHTDGVNSIAWSPDSTLIASASADKTVKVWQAIAH